jgi:DnaJ-class molecular chaperone
MRPKNPSDITVTLPCSLAEFFNGSLKTVKYMRNKILPDNRTIQQVEEEVQVEVKPGYDLDTILNFSNMGNE